MSIWIGAANAFGLTTVFASAALGVASEVPDAGPLPAKADMGLLTVQLSGLLTATSLTMYLSVDAAGAIPVSPFATGQATQTISVLAGGAGFCSWDLNRVPWVRETGAAGPFVWLRLNAGTATGARPRIYLVT